MSGLIRVIAVVALLTAGCGSQPPGAEPASEGSGSPQPPPPDGSTGVTSSTSVPTSGPISGPPLTSITPGGKPIPTGAPPSGGPCQSQPSVRIKAGDRPDPVCLPVSGLLHLASDPSPRQPWTTLISSDPKILSCAAQVGKDGAVTATCTPHLGGTVTISTMTAPFAGDPSGPPQYQWTLRVTVVTHGFNN
jgi:hypothetical protein